MIKLAELLGEKATFTSKYNDSPKLKGKQTELPDELQAKLVAKEGYDEFDMEDEGPDYNSVSDLEDELRRLVRWSNQYGSKGADSKIEQLKKRIEDLKKSPVNEGEDHEVSMAQNSLKSIIKSAIELHAKLGNMERDIPGWIQNHITNAENYIDQAAQGFHELNEGAKVREEPQGGGRIELVITSKDKAEVEKEIKKIEREYPSPGYGTFVKKPPFQKGDTWVAVVRRGTSSD
jgi:hypothetical protein